MIEILKDLLNSKPVEAIMALFVAGVAITIFFAFKRKLDKVTNGNGHHNKEVYNRLCNLEKRVDKIEARLDSVNRRLGSMELKVDAIDKKLVELAVKLDVFISLKKQA